MRGEVLRAQRASAFSLWLLAWCCLGLTGALAADIRPKGEFKLTEADKSHWAFQPIKRPEVPVGVSAVDFFIKRELVKNGLALAPRAAPETLIRRMSLDLIGLPPTPQEAASFAAECRSGSSFVIRHSTLETLADRLLSSPYYGERWGRHWLDLVRFA